MTYKDSLTADSGTRRRYIKRMGAAITVSSVGFAGCLGDDDTDDTDDVDDTDDTADEADTDDIDDTDDTADKEDINWLIGTSYPVGHILNEGFIDWADELREETDGRINIIIEEQLDGEFEMMELASIGAIDGVSMGSGWIVEFGDGALWMASPFIYDTWEENLEGFDHPVFQETVDTWRDEGGIHLAGPPIYRGARNVTANEALVEPEDFDGVDMRLPEVDEWVRIWSALGVNPTTVAFDELYSALQTGVVDAQENPVETIDSMGLPEVQDYLIRTEHVLAASWNGFNVDEWDNLHPEDEELISETLNSKARELDEEIMEREQELFDILEDDGMEIVDPNVDAISSTLLDEIDDMFDDGTFRGDRDDILP